MLHYDTQCFINFYAKRIMKEGEIYGDGEVKGTRESIS